MASIASRLDANRASVAALIAAAEQSVAALTTPRAPGKWSPAQIVEHVARTYDSSADLVLGKPSRFPTLPAFLRPVARGLLFNRVVKKGTFPKARTNKAMNPSSGPSTAEAVRIRLQEAVEGFETACRAHAGETLQTGTFGPVPLLDYILFMEVHARHHTRQIPRA